MKFNYILIVLVISSLNVVPQSWVQQVSNTNVNLNHTFFISEMLGYAVGDDIDNSILLKTTDGGNEWEPKDFPFKSSSLFFYDQNYGWATGHNPALVRTTDGGESWIVLDNINGETSAKSVFFLSKYTGWISCGKKLLKTVDGGQTWEQRYIDEAPNSSEITSIFFTSITNGYAITPYKVIRTIDGGITWIIKPLSYVYFDIGGGIQFTDANNGFILGTRFYKTSNAGVDWELMNHPLTGATRGASFLNNNYGILAGDAGQLFKTMDGSTWSTIQLNTYSDMNDIQLLSQNIGYAVGDNGVIFKYSQPTTTEDINSDNFIHNYFLSQNYPNPFNPSTKIRYQLPLTDFVTIKVYDILGNEIATLVNEEESQGIYEVEFDASSLTSGIYYYQLRTGSFVQTRKMILLK